MINGSLIACLRWPILSCSNVSMNNILTLMWHICVSFVFLSQYIFDVEIFYVIMSFKQLCRFR